MTALRKSIAALALTLPFTALAQAPAAPAEPAPAAPAAAPEPPKTPLVSVYGTLNVNLQYTEAGDATAGSGADVAPRAAISIDSSNVGVRGGFDISPALKAVYQCETQASVDGEDTRAICNRNSRVGFSGDWGTLFYGNWDTPHKAATYGTKADDPFGNTDVFGHQGIMGSPGYGVRSSVFAGNPQAGFDLRAANSVAYWTPKFAGLSAKVQWSVDEQRSADGVVSPMMLGAAVNYDLAGLSLVASTEYHEDAYGLRAISGENDGRGTSKDLAWKLAAGYELPLGVGALTVTGWLEQLMYEQESATVGYEEYSRLAWLVGAKFRSGSHELRARYSMALEGDCTAAGTTVCVEDDTGASHISLGYANHLAKNAQVFLFYTQIMNDDAAQYTFGVSGASRVVGANTPVGSDPMAIGLGTRIAF